MAGELQAGQDQRWTANVKDGSLAHLDIYVSVQAEPEYLDPPYHRKRVGMNHLAFAVSSKQQVDALATALVGRRVPLLYGGPRGGRTTYAVFFEDPDRIKIEVAAPVGS
ncbi:MAG: hypothetical protein E6I68_11895 [Chloroflexi bacterium]|nr:MAG: hypothetical protein E6I68_11895 [Chloroflexota bacterium]